MPAVIIVHYSTLASHACIQLHEVLQEGSIEDNEGLVFLGLLSFGVAAPDNKMHKRCPLIQRTVYTYV